MNHHDFLEKKNSTYCLRQMKSIFNNHNKRHYISPPRESYESAHDSSFKITSSSYFHFTKHQKNQVLTTLFFIL